nr:MAG TPA: hypothetical protein [Caudoviricetes sp.]DAN35497.1 MAG TPA: hypothetical protein [Caudoviricetes sp.]
MKQAFWCRPECLPCGRSASRRRRCRCPPSAGYRRSSPQCQPNRCFCRSAAASPLSPNHIPP